MRLRTEAYVDVQTTSIPTVDPYLHPVYESGFSLLLRLDSLIEPGLSQAQFQRLFAKCMGCGLYMTRRAVDYHECSKTLVGDRIGSSSTEGKIIIDLTCDSD